MKNSCLFSSFSVDTAIKLYLSHSYSATFWNCDMAIKIFKKKSSKNESKQASEESIYGLRNGLKGITKVRIKGLDVNCHILREIVDILLDGKLSYDN